MRRWEAHVSRHNRTAANGSSGKRELRPTETAARGSSFLKRLPIADSPVNRLFCWPPFSLAACLFFYAVSVQAAALTINGSQTFQTMDGMGVNINSLSWKNGESKPAIDMLADDMGCTLWRVVFDMEDWE